MVSLIIDSSREPCHVAIVDKRSILGVRKFEGTPDMGKIILLQIDEILSETGRDVNEIKQIGVQSLYKGKSSRFRAGVTIASTLAFALNAQLFALTRIKLSDQIEEMKDIKPVKIIDVNYGN